MDIVHLHSWFHQINYRKHMILILLVIKDPQKCTLKIQYLFPDEYILLLIL